jgi:hypothetical protein
MRLLWEEVMNELEVWVCFDCDKWFVVEREECECGSKVRAGHLVLREEVNG